MIVYVVIFPFKALAFSLKKACQPFSLHLATVTLWLVFWKFLIHSLAWQAVVTVVVCGSLCFLMMEEKTVFNRSHISPFLLFVIIMSHLM